MLLREVHLDYLIAAKGQYISKSSFLTLSYMKLFFDFKISGPPKIKGSEGCVSSYRYMISRYFDFPTAMFSSNIAKFKLYIEFLDFFLKVRLPKTTRNTLLMYISSREF